MKQIPEIPIKLLPGTRAAEAAIGYDYNPDISERSKIGGLPEGLPDVCWPSCCDGRMTFYAQLDSVGADYDLADCGLIFVFVCYDCFKTESILHGY